MTQPQLAEQLPYHRLARLSVRYRWWRPLLGTLVVAVTYLFALAVLMVLAVAVGSSLGYKEDADGWPEFGPVSGTAVDLLSIAVGIPRPAAHGALDRAAAGRHGLLRDRAAEMALAAAVRADRRADRRPRDGRHAAAARGRRAGEPVGGLGGLRARPRHAGAARAVAGRRRGVRVPRLADADRRGVPCARRGPRWCRRPRPIRRRPRLGTPGASPTWWCSGWPRAG
ncbi:hypothetical protein LT493_05545 [Streptomyces tricolor]|nr:hypothetical protein [Streptomyces tricolor]